MIFQKLFFIDAFDHAKQHILTGKTFEHLSKLQNA